MLQAFIFCLITCLLDVSCDLLSVTVGKMQLPDVTGTVGSKLAIYCQIQRIRLDSTSNRRCDLYRWLYDSRNMELTCVCLVPNSTQVNGQLLQVRSSRLIPSISQSKFKELNCVKQGQFEFEIKIVTESRAEETVHNLFFHVANKTGATVRTSCTSIKDEANAYTCITSYQNQHSVTWEFPENWSGPVQFIKNIAYDLEAINLQIVGMYWPKRLSINDQVLYVDTMVLVKRRFADVCTKLFENTIDETFQNNSKCRPEFYQKAVLNPSNFIAKLNLLIPVQWKEGDTMEQVSLRLANRLRWRECVCSFPVQIRKEAAIYVPSEVVTNVTEYEFVLTFATSIIGVTQQSVIYTPNICQKLKYLANGIIKQCNLTAENSNYGSAIVKVQQGYASVWEVQQQLMVQLNKENPDNCLVNVAVATYLKGY